MKVTGFKEITHTGQMKAKKDPFLLSGSIYYYCVNATDLLDCYKIEKNVVEIRKLYLSILSEK